MPQEMVDQVRNSLRWAELEAMAPTLAYDSEIMGDSAGGTVPAELTGCVSTETLVLVGGASPAWTIDIGRQVADAMPNGSTVSWKARSTSCLPRCSCRCWQSSSPDATNLIDGGDLVCCSGTKSVTFQGTEGGVRPG